jgi:hypothetical protein
MNFVNSESEFSDGSDYDRDVVVKFLCVNEWSDSCGEKDNVSDDRDMQHGTWTKAGAEQPHFPFSGKHGLNVN